jgi:hypothetical protein
MSKPMVALVVTTFALLIAQAPTDANAQTYFPGAVSCGEPEVSDPAVIAALNAKVGQYGGPPSRVAAIRGATSTSQDTSDAHTRCHSTLVLANGATEPGLLLQDRIQGVASWRWHSDQELSEGPASAAHQRQAAKFYDDMQRDAQRKPNETIACGLEGPQPAYTTRAVCYAAMTMYRDYQQKLKPYGAYALLQECGQMDSRSCLGMIAEVEVIANMRPGASKMTLVERCAGDLATKFPGKKLRNI